MFTKGVGCKLIKIRDRWFVVLFIMTLLFPLYGWCLEANITLNGVTDNSEIIEANINNIKDGTYQTYLNDKWENSFWGKKFLLRIRNQSLYSLCKVSPNSNVVIGKEGYLYEPSYILFEIQAYPPSSEAYFTSLGENLSQLQKMLNDNGKELYVFITPSKAHFYKEYIPGRYSIINNEEAYTYTNYSKLLETLNNYKIQYYDSVKFIEENIHSNLLKSPLFYKSGIHWSHAWGENAAAQFLDYMNSCSKYDFSSINIKEFTADEAVTPSTDLYLSLNLLLDPKEQWYTTECTIEKNGNDKPNIFLRGGSFMGQSLYALIQSGVFGKDVQLENNYYFTDQYQFSHTLSSFTSYEEMDLDTLLGQSDILVLEVNEAFIHTMSWGFIDYLLENPQYLDRIY